MYKNTIIATLIILLLVVFYGSFLAHKINLFTADLGRHIKNGEYFFQELKVPTTNLYSYTEPDFPLINHHWGAGVIFYGLWKIGGLALVHWFFILLSLITFLIFFRIAVKRAGLGLASLIAIPIIPLLAERTEIRPEMFSYLFAGIFYLLLWKFRQQELNRRWLLLLPIIEILWVNTHIYFFLGPVIVAVFVLENIISLSFPRSLPSTVLAKAGIGGRESIPRLQSGASLDPGSVAGMTRERGGSLKASVTLLVATSIVTLINPFGLDAIIEPFRILQEYGYRVVENQPVWFIEKLIYNPNFLIFKIVFGLLVLSFVYRFVRSPRTPSQSPPIPDSGRGRGRNAVVADILLTLGFSTMAWMQIRNFAIFGLFALPIMAGNLSVKTTHNSPSPPLILRGGTKEEVPPLSSIGGSALGGKIRGGQEGLLKFDLAALFVILVIILSGNLNHLFPYWHKFGIGLEKNNDAATNFWKANSLKGPIFNNYDIGGYLIYHLYPQEKVFVDNRPEAYSVDFFQKVYIPMQENEAQWQKNLEKYQFNAIFFSHRDATPWGQNFLLNRIKDPKWTQAYLDQYSIILLRK